MDYFLLSLVLSLAMSVIGHGRLALPLSRGQGYEGGPVNGATSANFVCRNGAAKTPQVTLTAGSTTQLTWAFGAAHVGDCSLWLSYDHAESRGNQKYFKIANFPDCNKDNNKPVTVNVPNWLKNGQAVMRWDWWGLHTYPSVEFYVQCVDVMVTGGQNELPGTLVTYLIPGLYPSRANQGAGVYYNPFGNTRWKMEGPPCAGGITGNCCDVSTYKHPAGYIASECSTTGSSVAPQTDAPTAANSPTAPPTTSAPTTSVVSECTIYTVKKGDTMGAIAENYTGITWQQMCLYNRPDAASDYEANCRLIEVGDNIVIPNQDSSSCLKAQKIQVWPTSNPNNPSSSAVSFSFIWELFVVAITAWVM